MLRQLAIFTFFTFPLLFFFLYFFVFCWCFPDFLVGRMGRFPGSRFLEQIEKSSSCQLELSFGDLGDLWSSSYGNCQRLLIHHWIIVSWYTLPIRIYSFFSFTFWGFISAGVCLCIQMIWKGPPHNLFWEELPNSTPMLIDWNIFGMAFED